ncbi:MAG: hypothetical protein CMH57_05020 [Myxococcales bacterium]|nr:hypothetical protein [Myxococcales bacterium]
MTTIPAPLRQRLTEGFGAPLERSWHATGGSINQAAAIEVGGERFFLKWNRDAPRGFFAAEVHGLQTLRAADAIRVPDTLEWEDQDGDCPAWLLMELIETPAARVDRQAFGRQLGEQLAALHQSVSPGDTFGLDRDNFIGALPQANPSATSWVAFLRDHRIGAQLDLARERGALRPDAIAQVERLMARLPDLLPDDDTPALLHGDLWSGNYMIGPGGAPVLIDPAVYRGHREIELAFTELFGGFPASMYEAYEAVWPLDPGYPERRLLYQVYPLLVHVNLFGGSYVKELKRAVAPYI